MTVEPDKTERRVLLLPPTRRDGEVTRAMLEKAGVDCVICETIEELGVEVQRGVGAVLLTEDVLHSQDLASLLKIFDDQPSWSIIPIVMLMRGGTTTTAGARVIDMLRNATLLERPSPMRTFTSAIQSAVRTRLLQYQVRGQIEAIREVEIQTRRMQEQLEIAMDASELGTFHCEMPLGNIIWNDRCKSHFWLPPEAAIDFDLFYSIIHPDDRDRTRIAIAACVEDKKPYQVEYRTVSPEGEIRWVRATGRTYYDNAGNPTRFDGTTQDVTERIASEGELRATQERFQAMANSIPQLAWMARPDGWLFWYNQRWYDYHGVGADEVEGWNWQSVHDPAELPRVIDKWKSALASGEPWEDTFPLRRHDGEFRWHLSRARPFRDSGGNVVLWFGTNTDITDERNKAQERLALLESERAARAEAERASRMKDEFLATLSHELRTPLNAILGWSQLLRRDGEDKETLFEGLAVIERNARVQTQLIEDLLDMSRIISGKIRLDVQTVQAATFIDAAIETVLPSAQAKGIRLQKVLDPHAGPIAGDPNRLQQIIWNLLSNAIKFTPRGGRVQVVLERINSHLEICVADTGQGISPDFLPHVFERFRQADSSSTRKNGGLGLGLAIVKQLVELHGGSVTAKSLGEEKGSTFCIKLPLAVVSHAQEHNPRVHPRVGKGPAVESECASLRGLNVLVVDDEPDARNLIKRVLEDCQARVRAAGSATEAMAMISMERPDVLVSDIGMPEVDGYEFLKLVRALPSHQGGKIPAIALTAFARSEDRTRALLAGFHVHVSKPVEPQELVATVASVGRRTG